MVPSPDAFDSAIETKGQNIQGVPEGCEGSDGQDTNYKNFENQYLQPGQLYEALSGGAYAGTLTLTGPDSDFGRGYVIYHGKAPVHGRISGLAVSAKQDAKTVSSGQSHCYAAGVAPSLLPKIQIENLTVSSFLPSPEKKLLGAFSVEDADGNRHAAFFIADLRENALTREFTWAHVTKREAQVQVMRFVDQADLFGDGREEVITEISYYENWRYLVLNRVDDENKWLKIFETDVLGCE